jgi:LysM repeat protein
MARTIMHGIKIYFARNPVPGTLLASRNRRHRIARGDTLNGIARRYSVSPRKIRRVNRLKSNHLKVGRILRIPPPADS